MANLHAATFPWLLTAVLAVSVTAQRTWIVDTVAGPGVDYTDIPPAVAAAAPWDRIEIRGSSGTTPTYSSFVVTKPLDIEATQGACVRFFRVENLVAGDAVRVAGLDCRPIPVSSTQQECVIVQNCQGTVLLANLLISTSSANDVTGFVVRDASAVVIQDCSSHGRSAGFVGGGAALVVERSGASLVRTTLFGGDAGNTSSQGYGGGPGLDVRAGSVYAAACTIEGGDGDLGWVMSGNGGDAVDVDPLSNVTIAASTLTRGLGAGGRPDGNAVWGFARVSLDCAVTGALVQGAVLVSPRTLLQSSDSVAPGGSIAVVVDGSIGTGFLIAFDLRHQHQVLPGIVEPLLLAATLTVAQVGVLTTPQFVWHLPVPNSPLLSQRDVFFQGAAFGTAAGITLTPLAATRMR